MGREENKLEIKNRIVEALFTVTLEIDLKAVTSDEIAREAGVSKRTLYKYYPSKEHMYLGMVEKAFMVFDRYMDYEGLWQEEALMVDNLLKLGRRYIDFMLENPIYGGLIMDYDGARYRNLESQTYDSIEVVASSNVVPDVLNQAVEDGKLRLKGNVVDIWLFMWSVVQGLSKLLLNKGQWISDYYDTIEQQLIDNQMKQMRIYLEGVIDNGNE